MKELYRSREDRMIAGICGGMGEVYGIDPTLTRLGLVFVALATGIMPAVIAYVIGAIIIPQAHWRMNQGSRERRWEGVLSCNWVDVW